MLDDGDETVCDDGRANLYSDSVFGGTPELLYFEVLLEPFEEQFNLPSILVQVGNFECCEMKGVG